MSKRQVEWARRAITRVRFILGGRCARCGAVQHLELDCIVPRGHRHHAAGYTARASFYRQQMREGNLQLLCRDCHVIKSATEQGLVLTSSVEEIDQ